MPATQDEVVLQQHMYILEKQQGFGFGIAVSGGRDNPNSESHDTAIVISDVIKDGPAYGKLQVGDIVLAVNESPMHDITHVQAVQTLKNAGYRAEVTIKRKAYVTTPVNPTPKARRKKSGNNYSEYSESRSTRSRTRRTSYSDDSRSRTTRSRTRNKSRYSDSYWVIFFKIS